MKEKLQAPRDRNNLEGRYANDFKIGHNAFEFVFDFGQFYPGNHGIKEAELCVRIITSPAHAKNLLETLKEAIDGYERRFGTIQNE